MNYVEVTSLIDGLKYLDNFTKRCSGKEWNYCDLSYAVITESDYKPEINKQMPKRLSFRIYDRKSKYLDNGNVIGIGFPNGQLSGPEYYKCNDTELPGIFRGSVPEYRKHKYVKLKFTLGYIGDGIEAKLSKDLPCIYCHGPIDDDFSLSIYLNEYIRHVHRGNYDRSKELIKSNSECSDLTFMLANNLLEIKDKPTKEETKMTTTNEIKILKDNQIKFTNILKALDKRDTITLENIKIELFDNLDKLVEINPDEYTPLKEDFITYLTNLRVYRGDNLNFKDKVKDLWDRSIGK